MIVWAGGDGELEVIGTTSEDLGGSSLEKAAKVAKDSMATAGEELWEESSPSTAPIPETNLLRRAHFLSSAELMANPFSVFLRASSAAAGGALSSSDLARMVIWSFFLVVVSSSSSEEEASSFRGK